MMHVIQFGSAPELRELDRRSNHGIEVALLWRKLDDRLIVTLSDARTGSAFEILVRDGERPLDVFHHPYAYAAQRRIDTTAGETLPWAA
jgi:hypothetical protein